MTLRELRICILAITLPVGMVADAQASDCSQTSMNLTPLSELDTDLGTG